MNEDKASRYHRLKRSARIAHVSATAAAVWLLLVVGASAWWRDVCLALVGPAVSLPPVVRHLAVAGVYAAGLALVLEVVGLPLAWYRGHVLERRYGMTTMPLRSWAADHAKGAAIALALGLAATAVVYGALAWSARLWWLPVALVFGGASVVLTWLAPVLVFPLFFTFTPVTRTDLAARLAALAQRAGATVLGVYEWSLGDRTRAANAALVGIGSTRRILLSDTLLAQYSDQEIEVILAHELAHHVHGDLWHVLRVDALLTAGALLAGHGALVVAVGHFGIRSIDDVAALPVLLAAAGAWSVVTMPLVNAMSRAHERRADRFALDLTRNPDAFVSAMRRLGAQHLADERPSALVEVLFHSHPPLAERIAAARAWAPTTTS